EVARGILECAAGGGGLELPRAEADQAVAAAGVDGQFERPDRPGPIRTGLEHVGYTPFLQLHGVGLAAAGALVELSEKRMLDAVLFPVASEFLAESAAAAKARAENGVGTGAGARPILVFNGDAACRRKHLLAHGRSLDDPARRILLAT